ncbi:DNRLRE domain-containing protein [Frankia sp. CNm7]|uniref:DNRLRE domain-containing protein n=1 Tax=Frankia nepalensis TaxID=1836974 RepID=A0A937URP8_9ACTN|nr:DNRLRE domain-containing protein [Frankia nepalensis]MBL7496454.1 DNRLRE domain-containing protein [Frankia nepalensis]MBL7510809.1 DNRLRE domain-containing protein [Frankia nepalensis]MBL7521694.1 DNRLRE domain-containing protein [Frankia nepalensis]MBL7631607.1 DNRLRE domain-containing protein [Frankia nepalensis]
MTRRFLPVRRSLSFGRKMWRRHARVRRVALLLVPALLVSGVVVLVVDRVTDPDLVPISEQNPFRDVKLPESSNGTAEGLEQLVPAEVTSRDAAPDVAEVMARVPAMEGAVPASPEEKPREVVYPTGADAPVGEVILPEVPAGAELPLEEDLAAGVREPDGVQPGRVEVQAARTDNASVFRNPDGTYSTEVSTEPVRFQDEQGRWVEVDTGLEEQSGGGFEAKSVAAPVEIAAAADDAELARIELGDGLSAGFALEGAAASDGVADGESVTFAEVREQADLELSASASGLKEVIVLQSADAPTSWTFPLALEGLTAGLDRQGRVVLSDGSGAVVAVVPRGWMEDSSPGRATSEGVTYSLVEAEGTGQPALRVDLDAEWLGAPERVFPVRVDPTVTPVAAGADDTWVSSATPGTAQGSDGSLRVGLQGTGDENRAYVHFPNNSALQNANILSAQVSLYNTASHDACTAHPVSLYQVTQQWNGTTLTWPGASISGEVAQSTFSHQSGNGGCPAGWETFSDSRLTELVEDWNDGTAANHGLSVRASSWDATHYKEFASQNCACTAPGTAGDYRPKMNITWSPYDAVYSWPTGSPVWEQALTATQPGKIKVRITNRGKFTWPANGSYKLSYHVYDATGTTELVAQGFQTNLPVAVGRGQSVDVLATVTPPPAGSYIVKFDMQDTAAGGAFFSTHGISMLPVALVAPPAGGVQVTTSTPADAERVETLRPVLSLTGNQSGLTYEFQICSNPDAASGFCKSSGGFISSSSWQVPADEMSWGYPYYWRGRVKSGGTTSAWTPPSKIYAQVPSPPTSAHFGGDPYVPAEDSVSPLIRNYASSTTDISVAGVGPALGLTRTYNSLNSSVGMFGTGWSSQWDMGVRVDDAGEGNLVVRYPDGRDSRFGRNWDGTFTPQDGYYSLMQAPSPQVASFTGANHTSSLGTADTGESWQVLAGTWGINGNNAYLVSGSSASAVMPAPSDGLIRFTAPVAQDYLGVAFRVQDANNMWILHVQPSSNSLILAKRVGGVGTQIATFSGACCAATDTYAVRMAGSDLTVYRNDRVVGSVTDAQFSTATKAGLFALSTGSGRIGSVTILDDQHRDSFTRADSSTLLGATDTGEKWQTQPLPGLGNGTWGISGNAAYLATASGNRNMATVSAAADGQFSFKMPVAQAGLGLVFRYADPNNYWRVVAQPSAGTWQLVKRVGGVETVVATSSGGLCCTASDTMTVVTNGPNIYVQRNGSQILSTNDPAVFYGSRAGPFAEATGSGRIDDFTATAAVTLTEKSGDAYTFRSDGRLAKITDPAGLQLELNHNSNAQLTSVVNLTTLRTLSFTWTGTHVTSVSTQSVAAHSGPLTWTYAYDGDKITSVAGPHTTSPTEYDYAFNGKLGAITLPEGNVDTIIGYNLDGTVQWREDGLGNRTEYEVLATSPNTIVRVTDPRDHETEHEYRDGQLVAQRDNIGSRQFVYNDRGFPYQVIDENGNIVQTETDTRGNVIARSQARAYYGGTLFVNTEYYNYYLGAPGDPRNDLVTVHRDARSASPSDNTYATFYGYNSFGHMTARTSPAVAGFPGGRTETWIYSTGAEAAVAGGGTIPRGLEISHTDTRGKTDTSGYDAKGDLRRDQDPAGLVHEYTYDEIGREVTSKEISDTFPAGLTTTTAYTKLGLAAQVTEPGVTNLVTSVVHTPVTTNTYDANGNLTQVTVSDATGGDTARTTSYTYDDADRETYKTVGAGSFPWATYATTYDPNGNVATTTDPNGTVTSYTYTAHNQLATTTLEDFVDDPVAGSSPRDVVLESRAYDPADRLASVTDAEGRAVRYQYWLDGLVFREIHEGYRPPDLVNGVLSGPAARDIILAEHVYDGAGNEITEITDGGLLKTSTEYDAAGRPTATIVDPQGVARRTDLTYDGGDNVTATELSAAGTTTTERVEYTFDDVSRPTSTTVFGNGVERFTEAMTYDQRGEMTSRVDPRGYVSGGPPNSAYVTDHVSDAAGNPAQAIRPSVLVEENGAAATSDRPSEEVGYNTFGEVTHVRDARNQVTVTAYDHLGRVTQKTYPSYTPPGGGSAIVPTESWNYDDNGNPTTHVDTRGKTTTTVYDKRDRVVAVTDPQLAGAPAAGVTRKVYDDVDNLVSEVDQEDGWTFYAYDDLDRVWATTVTEQWLTQTFTTYTVYNDADDIVRVLLPANVATGASTTSTYNGAGDRIAVQDELGKTTTYTYDLAGRVTSVTDPLGRETRTTYDRAGRKTTVAEYSPTDVLLRSTSTGYDAAGNVVSETDANGHAASATFDALNQRRTIVIPIASGTSVTTSVGYDLAGNATRVTDGRGNATITTYNSLSLVEKIIEPSTTAHPNLADRTWTTTYDAGSLPVSVVAPGGVTRTSTYDALGRLTAESGSGVSTPSASRTLAYDLVGQLVAADFPGGTQSFTYNDRGLITGASGPGGTSSFTYDSTGRMSGRTDPGSSSTFTYTPRGELATVTGTVTGGTRTLGYDDAGQITSVTYSGATRTFGYDDLGRTISDTLTGPGGTVLRGQSYTYDNNDNRLSTTLGPLGVAGAGTQTYTYDWADRLTSWTDQANVTTTYGWDAAGNRTSENAAVSTFDQRNRLLSDGTSTYTYTARGTLATTTEGSTVTTTSFDAFGRLLGDNEGGTLQTYTYDGLDRLATRDSAPFTYAGLEKEPATDWNSAFSRDPDGDLVAIGTSSGNWATVTDTHGDLVAAFTTAGVLTDSRSYTPFGEPVVAGNPNLHIGYQGSWTDPDTDKVNAQARWYTPDTGTFISRDPANLPITGTAASNRYTYAAANPLAYNDPTGFWSIISAVKKATKAVTQRSAEVARARNAGLSLEAQRQIAQMGEARFWAGVRASLAGVKPAPPPRPDLSGAANRQIAQMGQKNFWDGVRAALAFQAAAKKAAADKAARDKAARDKAAREKAAREKAAAEKAAAEKAKKKCGRFDFGCKAKQAVSSVKDKAKQAVTSVKKNVQTAGNWVAKNKLVSLCANFAPGSVGAACGGAQALGHLVNGRYKEAALSAGGAVLAGVGGGAARGAVGGGLSKLVAKGCKNSFTPDTPVLLADGTSKPIADIDVGDRVLATDPVTGRTEPHTVTNLIIGRGAKILIDLEIQTDRGPATLTATHNHPFWEADDQTWTDAEDLDAGDTLRQPDGTTVTITGTVTRHQTQAVYNLTVADLHTYYVLVGKNPVLVHNCKKNQGVYEFADQWNPGSTYVGKTSDFDKRLQHHIDTGRLRSRADAKCTHVCGNDDDLFVAEHLRIQELRGQGVQLSNQRASPGKKILEQRGFQQLRLW